MFLEISFCLILRIERRISYLAESLYNTCQVVLCINVDGIYTKYPNIYKIFPFYLFVAHPSGKCSSEDNFSSRVNETEKHVKDT